MLSSNVIMDSCGSLQEQQRQFRGWEKWCRQVCTPPAWLELDIFAVLTAEKKYSIHDNAKQKHNVR